MTHEGRQGPSVAQRHRVLKPRPQHCAEMCHAMSTHMCGHPAVAMARHATNVSKGPTAPLGPPPCPHAPCANARACVGLDGSVCTPPADASAIGPPVVTDAAQQLQQQRAMPRHICVPIGGDNSDDGRESVPLPPPGSQGCYPHTQQPPQPRPMPRCPAQACRTQTRHH
jgi:hypothetical protein